MIQWYAKKIEEGLNDLAVNSGIERTFKIFADSGELPDVAYDPTDERDAQRIEGEIYGVFDAQPSRLAPIPGVTVLSINGTLSVLPEIKLGRSVESGEFQEDHIVEDLLEAFVRENNGKTYEYIDDADSEKKFTVSASFSPVVCGDWEMHSTALGETIPLSVSVYLTAVQSGVSSNDVTVYIDGYPVFYESLLPARQKTLDQFTYSREPIKSVVEQHAMTIDIVLPLLRNKICDALLEEMLDGSFTVPHSVVLKYPSGEREYICTLASANAPAKPGQNVGMALSFVEAKKDVALEEMGEQLERLGSQFKRETMVAPSYDGIYINDISGAYGITLEKGKRYAYAMIPYVGGRLFGSFEYDGENKRLLETSYFTIVRMTYGE